MYFRLLLIIILISLSSSVSHVAAQENLRIEAIALSSSVCSGHFIEHILDHITTVKGVTRTFESNGAGLAINDLNNDGLLDIVLANQDGAASILWNDGKLNFHKQELDVRRTRAVSIVDVNSDGKLDIVFTTQIAAPQVWINRGNGEFEQEALPGVGRYAYTLDWADFDGNGTLDLATASYDADLTRIFGNNYLFNPLGGVVIYTNAGGTFRAQRLAAASQALALIFADLNHDSRPDLAIGNDFATPDQFFQQTGRGWEAFQPFQTTSYSTMSLDYADIFNAGKAALLEADMQPYPGEDNQSHWSNVLTRLTPNRRGEQVIQLTQNMLHVPNGERYAERANPMGISATGWSWSAKFGDLDSDGFQDLYVVNGMIAQDLFPNLPGGELIEENQSFRNNAGKNFTLMPNWGLGSTSSGRGMSMADLDNDGDLDIVINNLNSPAQLFENQLCGGQNLEVELRRADVPNTFAIGARVTLITATGKYQRMVRASSGYLSGEAVRLHFGVPANSNIQRLEIDWGDGQTSLIKSPSSGFYLTITHP